MTPPGFYRQCKGCPGGFRVPFKTNFGKTVKPRPVFFSSAIMVWLFQKAKAPFCRKKELLLFLCV